MKYSFLLLFVGIIKISTAQSVVPGQGIDDIKIGSSPQDVEDILGFLGKKISYEDYQERLSFLDGEKVIENFIGFDYCLSYRHIMLLPITNIFFKDDKVVMIVIDSNPEYNRRTARALKTSAGLKFWDDLDRMEEIYGSDYGFKRYKKIGADYFYYFDKGIGFSYNRGFVRAIHIFSPTEINSAKKYLSVR